MQFAGQSLNEAAEAVIMDELVVAGGDGGIVAVDAGGEVAMVFNTPGMYRASVSGSGVKSIGIFSDEP
jgi:beta-aspartyl-peptidase (threonine type)